MNLPKSLYQFAPTAVHTRAIVLIIAILAVVLVLIPARTSQSQQTAPDYKNAKLPIDARVADLLERMTLEEKVAQLVTVWAERPQVKAQTDFSVDRGEFSPVKAQAVMKNGIGQIA